MTDGACQTFVIALCCRKMSSNRKKTLTTQTLLVLSLLYNLHFYFKLPKPFYLYREVLQKTFLIWTNRGFLFLIKKTCSNRPFSRYSTVPCASVSKRAFVQNLSYCLISYREGLGTSLLIMGLATIDPHSLKEHTKIHKFSKFGVNRASFDSDSGI